MSFEQLNKEVNSGLSGRNGGIPMGFDRLNRYIGIRKAQYHLLGGLTGSGKTSFLDDCYVLNPYDWYMSKEGQSSGIKLKIIYRSMERSRTYKLAKWVCRKIFVDYGIIIPVSKLLGWTEKLSKDEHDLFLCHKDYIEEMKETITIIDGPENPVGIAKELKMHALDNGIIEDVDQYNKIYIPNQENEITIVIIDHIGLLKTTKDHPTKKESIDKMSNELRYAKQKINIVIIQSIKLAKDLYGNIYKAPYTVMCKG